MKRHACSVGSAFKIEQTNQHAQQRSQRLKSEGAHNQPPAQPRRNAFGDVGDADGIVRSDANSEEEAEDDQRCRIPRRCRCRGEDHKQDDVDHEHPFAPHPVGNLSKDQRAEERARNRRNRNQAFGGGVHVEVVGDQGKCNADDKEVEAVQQHTHRRQDPHLALGFGEGRVVQMLLKRF